MNEAEKHESANAALLFALKQIMLLLADSSGPHAPAFFVLFVFGLGFGVRGLGFEVCCYGVSGTAGLCCYGVSGTDRGYAAMGCP
eukprot:148885-Rhodomonas_salina.1